MSTTKQINHLFRYEKDFLESTVQSVWRRVGLIVSALDSRSSGPGSSGGRGYCVVFLGKTLNSRD